MGDGGIWINPSNAYEYEEYRKYTISDDVELRHYKNEYYLVKYLTYEKVDKKVFELLKQGIEPIMVSASCHGNKFIIDDGSNRTWSRQTDFIGGR